MNIPLEKKVNQFLDEHNSHAKVMKGYGMTEVCSNPMIRTKLNEDVHIQFMEQRRQEYLKNPWTRDVWEEELTRYLDKDDKEYYSMLKSHDNIKVTANNADKVVAFLMKLEELKKYDFKEYMHRNWDKNI